MEKDDEQIQSLIAGGAIGAALGALLSEKNSGTSALIGAIAGAAIFASIKAKENASKAGVPIIIEKNNALYQINPDGTEVFLKPIHKPTSVINKKFILK